MIALIELLRNNGRFYRKIVGLQGFAVTYVRPEDGNYSTYNELEDAEYDGPGIYITGLLGETWRLASIEKLISSYEFDDAEGGCPITPEGLAERTDTLRATMPNGSIPAIPVRYRSEQTPPIFAIRAPLDIDHVDCDSGNGRTTRLAVNATVGKRGQQIDHGKGDMIVCAIAPAESDDLGDDSFQVSVLGQEWKVSLDNLYVVNGAVFDKTYRPVEAES